MKKEKVELGEFTLVGLTVRTNNKNEMNPDTSKIIDIRHQKILIDADVAELYGIETKQVNQAVKNNPEKFPDGYLLELDDSEKNELVKNFDRFQKLKHSSATIKGFTERGLYMLATF